MEQRIQPVRVEIKRNKFELGFTQMNGELISLVNFANNPPPEREKGGFLLQIPITNQLRNREIIWIGIGNKIWVAENLGWKNFDEKGELKNVKWTQIFESRRQLYEWLQNRGFNKIRGFPWRPRNRRFRYLFD